MNAKEKDALFEEIQKYISDKTIDEHLIRRPRLRARMEARETRSDILAEYSLNYLISEPRRP